MTERAKKGQEEWRKEGASLYFSISTREKCQTHKANEQERIGHGYY